MSKLPQKQRPILAERILRVSSLDPVNLRIDAARDVRSADAHA